MVHHHFESSIEVYPTADEVERSKNDKKQIEQWAKYLRCPRSEKECRILETIRTYWKRDSATSRIEKSE